MLSRKAAGPISLAATGCRLGSLVALLVLATQNSARTQTALHHRVVACQPGGPAQAALVACPADGDLTRGVAVLSLGSTPTTASRSAVRQWQQQVCANSIVAAGVEQPAPYSVLRVGQQRTAVVGLVVPMGRPEGSGPRFSAPVDALRSLLPTIRKEADTIVVLAHMDRMAAAELLRSVDGLAAVIVPARGANDPEPIEINGGLLVQSPDAPGTHGVLDLGKRSNRFVAEPVPPAASPATSAFGVDLAKWVGKPPAPRAPDQGSATGYRPGVMQVVSAEDHNRALALRAHAFTIQPSFAGRQALAGRAFLVADVEWTNDIPTQYAFGNEVPVAFRIDDLREIFFAVVDGARLGRFDAELSALPGGLLEQQPLLLPYVGSQRRGTAVFEIPAQECTMLDLRFYDFTHGHIAVPLLRRAAQADSAPLASLRNELMEVAVFAALRDGERVFVDLRARSVWPLEVDATAFDPAAKSGARMQTPTLGRWQDVQDTVLLHVDGAETGLRPLQPADTLLLPDVAVGDGVSFVVPATAQSLELRISYPTMSVPGRGEPLQPAPLRIPLGPHLVAGVVPGVPAVAAEPQPVDPAPTPAPPPVPVEPAKPVAPGDRGAPAEPELPVAKVEAPSPAVIAAAVLRGGEFLWRELAGKDPRALGQQLMWSHDEELLATLALAHAGVTGQVPAAGEFARELLRAIEPGPRMDVYQVGVAMMLIDQLGDPAFLPLLQALATYLVEAQSDDGSWHYTEDVPKEQLQARDGRVLQVAGGRPFDGSPVMFTKLERQRPFGSRSGDNSTTQFALLGLHAAALNGIGIPAPTWQRANACVRERQNPDGGFSYSGERGAASSGSMTAAGLSMLLLSERDEQKARAQPEVERAEQWLDRRFTVETNPGGFTNVGYWRYGIERTGRLLGRERLGRHDWFALGAAHLLAQQKPAGNWEDVPVRPVQDTSFALLFLTRATRPLRVELQRGGLGVLTTAVIAPPPNRVYVVLDASGSMLEQVNGQGKFQGAVAALEDLVAKLPAGTSFALRAYGHRLRATEKGADADTELLLPFAPLDVGRVRSVLAGLRARGRTPLALSMAKAREDIAQQPAAATTLVLLTDGGEDPQSKRDPRSEAAELQRAGVTLFVVGFDIRRDDWNQQLREVAARGAGSYIAAADGQQLRARVLEAVVGLPGPFRLFDAAGKQVAEGSFGDTLRLPEGNYRLSTDYGGREVWSGLWVNTDVTTRVVFDVVNARRL